eukprot:973918-Pleurochrysis_carterae.AAC.7
MCIRDSPRAPPRAPADAQTQASTGALSHPFAPIHKRCMLRVMHARRSAHAPSADYGGAPTP